MRNRLSQITNAIFLAMLLLSASISREAIHHFAGHEDTVHATHDEGGTVIEKKHTHCSFLDDVLMPFTPAGVQAFTLKTVTEYLPVGARRVLVRLEDGLNYARPVRGPPVV